jgi:uncharacterized protein (TIGR03067 family)
VRTVRGPAGVGVSGGLRMKKLAVLTLGLFACAALAGRAPAQDEKKADAPKIEGKWTLTGGKKNGGEVDDNAKKSTYTADKDKITIEGDGAKFVMGYKIDPKNPTNVDFEILEAPIPDLKGSKAEGIIELKGDELKIAYSTEKGSRPKNFDGKDGFLFIFKKAK